MERNPDMILIYANINRDSATAAERDYIDAIDAIWRGGGHITNEVHNRLTALRKAAHN